MSSEIKRFEFGGFVLDCEEQALLLDGKPVSLTPKAYLLLKTLVENPGRILEKAELMEAVWPDSFVEEGNLPFTAFSLRKALGDSSEDPRFIETVPRRGYRFVAEVTAVSAEVPSSEEGISAETTDEEIADGAARWRRPALGFAAAAAAIVVLGWGVWFVTRAWSKPTTPILSRPFSVEKLSTSGNSARAAISPDGTRAVYSDEAGGKQSLWLRNLETSENVQIVPPTEDEYLGLRFSQSGNSVYFVRLPAGMHGLPSLYRVETVGGVPVKLADNVNKRLSVSADDSQIAFARCMYRRDDFCALIVADANGSNERRVMVSDPGIHIWDIAFSPDGRSVAVAAGRSYNEMNDSLVYEVDTQTGEKREIFPERFAEVNSVEWVPDGSAILLAASEFQDGKLTIYSADRRTGKLQQITRDAASYDTLTLDREANRMVAVQQIPEYRIHVVTNGSTEKLAVARDMAVMPGGRIVYATYDGELWSVNRDGTEQRQLTRSRHAETAVCPSPDGKQIYFSTDESGSRQVWRMNQDGTDPKQLTQSPGGFPLTATSDGRFIFYESTLNSRLRRVSTDGSGDTLISEDMLSNPAVSPDGAYAAYFFTEAMVRKLAIMDLSTMQNARVFEAPPNSVFVRPLAWSEDGKTIHYLTNIEGRNTLWRSPVSGAAPQKAGDLGEGHVIDISAVENGNFVYIIGGWRFDVMLIRGLA